MAFAALSVHNSSWTWQNHAEPLYDFDSEPLTSYPHSLVNNTDTTGPTSTLVYARRTYNVSMRLANRSKKAEGQYPTLCTLLLLAAGDISSNPGPRPPRYPCAIGNKAVKWGQDAV